VSAAKEQSSTIAQYIMLRQGNKIDKTSDIKSLSMLALVMMAADLDTSTTVGKRRRFVLWVQRPDSKRNTACNWPFICTSHN